MVTLVCSAYLSACLKYFAQKKRKSILLFFFWQYIQYIDFIPKHFRHTVPKVMIGKSYAVSVRAVLLSWQGQRGEEQFANLTKTAWNQKPDLQEYERHYCNLSEKWRCSLFTTLFRLTEEESLRHVSEVMRTSERCLFVLVYISEL